MNNLSDTIPDITSDITSNILHEPDSNDIVSSSLDNFLESQLWNIYVIENDAGYIKIGRTQNFQNRLQNLKGSNGGGHYIVDYFLSEPTYLYSLESVLHNHFYKYRIPNTEWFSGIDYDQVVLYLQQLFKTDEYKKCNHIRENYYVKVLYNRSIIDASS